MRISGLLLVAGAIAAAAGPARGAPQADLVVVWAPGLRTTPIEQAARRAGAAVIDQSPKPEQAAQTAKLVQTGVQAFEEVRFADAWQALENARSGADRTGAEGLTQAQLSDLFLYRGLVKAQQGDSTGSWEELVVANTIDPTRELDPGRFPPKVREDFERARDTVKQKARAKLTVQAPEGCATNVDGRPAPGPLDLIVGPHWISTRCVDRRPTGYRIELTGDVRVPIEPAPYTPQSDSELLIQARAASARAFIVVEVRGNVATARLLRTADGREVNRKTVSVSGDLAPLADGVTELLTPPPERRWYESKAVWAIGGGLLAAAILVPLTAYLSSDTTTANPTGKPAWPTPDMEPPWSTR